MARGRPHGRSKSDHRVCQEARYARAAEYRERIAISAEQQEARIAAVNAECNVEDAPWRRRRQESRKLKVKAGAARVSAGGPSCKASGSAAKKAKKGLEHSLGKAAESDLHSLHCQACGATAEFGLRGSKEGGTIKYSCEAHAAPSGCFRIDRDRAAWAADQELRRLKAKLRRLEQELRDLGGAAEDAPSAPAFAAGQESGSTTDWVSMPKSRSLIATLLLRGGVESNPGPTSQEEKEVALKKGWQAVDSDIDSDLLEHLANQQLTVDRWRGMSDDGRSKLLDRLERGYPGPGNWLLGWNAIFDKAAAFQPPPKRACRRMKVFSLQDGIDREGFFRGSEEAPQVIEMIKKGQYPLIADVRKAGKTTLKQEIVDLLDGKIVDTIRGKSEVRVVAVTLGWGLEMHGQESETAFWKYVIDDVVHKSQGLLVRHPDTTDSSAGFASLFQWIRPTGPLIALCVDEASELAKASVMNRASLMHCFRDLREAATRRQHRLLSVAFFGTFTVLRIVDELNEGRPGPSGAIFRTSPFLLATGPEVIRGLRRFSTEDIVQLLEEYAELCKEELAKRPVALPDLQRIAESIFEKTRGHKGQTIACLMALQNKQLLEKNLDGPLVVEQWLQYLRTDLPAYIAQSTVFRATVQSALQATPAQLELLSSVLYNGTATVPADQVQEIAEPLLAEGVLVEEAHGESSEFGYRRAAVAQAKSPVTLALASPLISSCIFSNMVRDVVECEPAPAEYLEYIDFLVIETVRNLNWATIACYKAANASGEPSEYALQGQFWLILNQLLRKTQRVQFVSLVAEARNITTTSGNVRRRIDFLCWPLPHLLGTVRPFAIELIAFAGRADILEHMRRGYPKLHAAEVDGRVETCHTVVVHVSADWAAKRGATDYFGPPEGVEDVHVVQVLFKENGAKARIAFEDRERDREIPVAGLRKEAKMVLSKLTTPPSSTPGTQRPSLPQPR